MSNKSCGCTTSCDCCAGTRQWTPAPIANRPGLDEIAYRAGLHGEFFETMKARLSTMTVEAPGVDGQTLETFRPLEGLTTRDPSDPSIALLDTWATVGDVLTFYQERIANEGYLRTAQERRSILELSRLTGYALRPGVASSVYLAYTLEDSQAEPVVIEAGRRCQSIPGPGEAPQFFETSEKLAARREWNNLKVQTTRPQVLQAATCFLIPRLVVAGTTTGLKAGDTLLIEFDGGQSFVTRRVTGIVPDFTAARTTVDLFLYPGLAASMLLLVQFQTAIGKLSAGSLLTEATQELIKLLQAGERIDPLRWTAWLDNRADGVISPAEEPLFQQLAKDIVGAVGREGEAPSTTDVQLIEALLLPPAEQKRSSQALGRTLESAFAPGADNNAQLLVGFATELKRTYFGAFANANLTGLKNRPPVVYAMRASAQLFGSTVSKIATFDDNVLQPQNLWDEWDLDGTEGARTAFLDQGYDAIAPGGYIILRSRFGQQIRKVTDVETAPRTAYGVSGKSTELTLGEDWWKADQKTGMAELRATLVLAQSEPLELVDEPVTGDINGQEIGLGQLYEGLTSGRWVILSGERTDVNGSAQVRGVELHMVSGLKTSAARYGEPQRTTLVLATPTAYRYKRDTLTIYGNVVKATNGETRQETLGSGDGAVPLPTFALKQPPLTFVAAPTAAGVESTLAVYVNNVQWHEKPTLAGATASDRVFVTQTDNAGVTSVTFGNGVQGARLPGGVENIQAVYRSGIGRGGNVLAEQISLVQTAPLGIKSVINPLRASGGADAEGRDQARENAPLAVMALDRLVSLQDYEDFTRTFAGIGKARVAKLTDGQRKFIHLTIAGADDIPIDTTSDLYRNLLLALTKYGDPDLPVRVDSRELLALVLSANVKIGADYRWEPVSDQIRALLLDTFGFARRALGQPALRCEVIAAIQSVPGVTYVDVDVFDRVEEKITARRTGSEELVRRYRTPDELSDQVQAAVRGTVNVAPVRLVVASLNESSAAAVLPASGKIENKRKRPDGVVAALANVRRGLILPAQLAIFSPSVPDTLVLNQIA